ncbi:MAG: translation initiation factor IF-2 [Blautia hansenii]
MVTVKYEIDFEKAQKLHDYDIIAEQEEKVDVIEELLKEDEEDESTLVSRPPVVCVMGHVDHGKTSLLDCIRKTHVTDREAGGITQHIGAYMVNVDGQKITFLDTPGHEAFTAMRMRGANATDIAILVVAADDGVMPQTVEAINHAKAAGVEIIVAINKIDKPSANIERVKQELSEYELIPEDWGGSTIFAPVSAHTGEGIDNLLEMILLTAEVGELKANPNRRARGLVIEAELDKGKGPVATILVQKGTLRVGDFIAAGASSGKVRAMIDDKGRKVKEAGPSTPVEILGLSDVPNAGEILVVTENDKEAKNFAATFVSENKNRLLEETKAKMSLDDLFSQIQAGNLKELPIIVKADVQGSVEAVKQSLVKLSNEEVVVKVIHGGVGSITESDVTLASASNAIIIGFNVRPDATAKSVAEQEGVDLRLYRVIYQAIEDVEAAMKGMLDPVFEEKVIGHAEVRQIFKASGVGNIAGSYVLDGIFQRNCKVRITREGEQIFEGALASLKRFKDDVKEVKAGYECGLVFEDFNDIKEEDKVEAYIMVEVPR